MMDLVRIPTRTRTSTPPTRARVTRPTVALVSWHRAASPERGARFSAYRAASDREDAAALAWMQFRARHAR